MYFYVMFGIEIGLRLFYVGDYIYGDILWAKKEIDWCMMFVVFEFVYEIDCLECMKEKLYVFRCLCMLCDFLDD